MVIMKTVQKMLTIVVMIIKWRFYHYYQKQVRGYQNILSWNFIAYFFKIKRILHIVLKVFFYLRVFTLLVPQTVSSLYNCKGHMEYYKHSLAQLDLISKSSREGITITHSLSKGSKNSVLSYMVQYFTMINKQDLKERIAHTWE